MGGTKAKDAKGKGGKAAGIAKVVKAQPVKRPSKAAKAAAKAPSAAERLSKMVDKTADDARRIDETGAPAHRAASKYYRGDVQPLSTVQTPNDDQRAARFLEVMLPPDAGNSLSLTHTRSTPPVLSKFEKALVLGHRARELALGEPTLAPVTEWNPSKIAEMELHLGLLDDYCIARALHGRHQAPENWILGDFSIL